MTINIECETTLKVDFDYEDLLKQVINATMDFEKCPYEAEVSVLLTDDDEIRKMNQEFRGIDAPTDVLSFPMVEYDIPGDFTKIEETSEDSFHPETGELMLGDIVISIEKVRKQAEEYGHSFIRELAFLTAHSMFHLFGYDHMDEEESVIMEEKQNKVLEELKIVR